jgi:hypothetical protein
MKRKRSIVVVSIIAVAMAGAVVAFWRLNRTAPLVLSNGEVVADLTTAEVGMFADPRFESIRRLAFENRRAYDRYTLSAVSPSIDRATLKPIGVKLEVELRQILGSDRAGIESSRILGNVEKILRCVSGEDFEAYSRDPINSAWPLKSPERQQQGLSDVEIAEDWRERYVAAAKSVRRVVSANLATPEVAARVSRVQKQYRYTDTLSDRLSDEELTHFRGGVSSAAVIFRSLPDDYFADGTDVVSVDIVMVIEDEGADRYPVWMSFVQASGSDQWFVNHVFRTSSVRAASQPAWVF